MRAEKSGSVKVKKSMFYLHSKFIIFFPLSLKIGCSSENRILIFQKQPEATHLGKRKQEYNFQIQNQTKLIFQSTGLQNWGQPRSKKIICFICVFF